MLIIGIQPVQALRFCPGGKAERQNMIRSNMRFSKTSLIILAIVIAAIAGLAYWGLAESPAEDSGAEMKYKEVTVTRGTFQEMVSANGIVRPIDRIEIKSKASGEIVALPVEQGDFVKKGDLIARLDQKDESAAVKQAEADLDIAKAELAQAQRSFERRDQLFQENLISEEERDQIELSLAVAKGKLVQSSTTLERARERFSESVVRAPIDGVILQKYVEEGQIIASGVSNVSGGTAIVDIADMRSVYIEAGIDEIDIGKIRVGQAVAVEAEAYPQLKFRGSVIRIAPEAKIEQNVTLFDVIVEVENPEGKLKSGMNSTIEITIVNEENVLLVPAMAFQSANQAESRSGSWGENRAEGRPGNGGEGRSGSRAESRGTGNERTVLLKENGRYVPRQVRVGRSNFKQAIVLDGLAEGDVLGVPMVSRLKAENDQLEQRIRNSRSFGSSNNNNRSTGGGR